MICVQFSEGRDDSAIEVVDDMITDADGQGLASCEWTRRVDDTLDKLMDADDDHLSVGPWRDLAYVIQDGVGLIGISGTENCEHGRADGVESEEEDLVD